jgi:predicted nucleic acid-binding protein
MTTDIRQFQRHFRITSDTAAVTRALLALLEATQTVGKQVHDANIVAAMQVYGIRRLLTHNTDDFARFAHLIEIIPLNAAT